MLHLISLRRRRGSSTSEARGLVQRPEIDTVSF